MKIKIVLLLIIISILGSGCATLPIFTNIPTPTPTPTPTPVPMEICFVDWNWGGATLDIFGPNANELCYNLVAYGYLNHGLMFYNYGDTYGESILCQFEGTEHLWTVWDEPAWEAGGAFCRFLGRFETLP